jgi:hypothetical protein
MRKALLAGLTLVFASVTLSGQRNSKLQLFFSEPVITDSSSTLIIPVRYRTDLLTSNKIGNYYFANIIFYNFKTDSYKRIFDEDTYIREFCNDYNAYYRYDKIEKQDYISNNWIFYFVKSDYNKNGSIDSYDPCMLYVTDKHGDGLKSITPVDENAVSIKIYDKLGFALIKMQRDADNNKKFDTDDNSYYYVRLDLQTLTQGNKIEIK